MTKHIVIASLFVVIVLLPSTGQAAVWEVPLECPTIQAGIDSAASGDTVRVANGIYTGDGNRDISYLGKGVTVQSASGDPTLCVINCGGYPHRGFRFVSSEGPGSVLDGFTITNADNLTGAAIRCSWASPVISNCILTGNQGNEGSAVSGLSSSFTLSGCIVTNNSCVMGPIYMDSGAPTLEHCVIAGNSATMGILFCHDSDPTITGCTLADNSATVGGAIYANGWADVTAENTIVAFSGDWPIFDCWDEGRITLSCCNVYGNDGGDYVSCVATQGSVRDNFSSDPLFCDAEGGDYRLHCASPCLNAPGCGLVGALGLGDCVRAWSVPAEVATIQAAIDLACDGDTILVADGTYTGTGNRDLDFGGKAIVVRSETGDPSTCIIDCDGSELDEHRGFLFNSGEDSTSVVMGFTIRNAYMDTYTGAAFECSNGSSPTITYCVMAENTSLRGPALNCSDSSPIVSHCTIVDNHPTFSTLYVFGSAHVRMSHCIVVYSDGMQAFRCGGEATASLTCCDVHQNGTGLSPDWGYCLEGQGDINGNMSAPPRFCDREAGDYHLNASSPCATAPCGIMGALGVGCAPRIWHVPADAPTIAAGLDSAAAGDTVEVACGTYYEHDLDFDLPICLRSETGDPECVLIDAGGLGEVMSCGYYYYADSLSSIRGITFTGGRCGAGPGLYCWSADPRIHNCVFTGNHAITDYQSGSGGAMFVSMCSPVLTDCVFHKNVAGDTTGWGGAVWVSGWAAHPLFERCTFSQNSVRGQGDGGALSVSGDAHADLFNCIIAFSKIGEAVACDSVGDVTLACCDVFGNAGGDWVGNIAGQAGTNGNFEADPIFCDTLAGDFALRNDSPCAAGHNPTCGRIGARAVGCLRPPGVLHVPSEFPTIRAAVDSSITGDSVVVACGTYYEHDIEMKSGVTVVSETGEPDCVTIDAQGLGRIIYCNDVDSTAHIVGFTITGGSESAGGGVYCSQSYVNITRCLLTANTASDLIWGGFGGGAYCGGGSPAWSWCTFTDNLAVRSMTAGGYGGAVYCLSSSPTFTNCTFFGNEDDGHAGGLRLKDSSPTLVNTIIASSVSGAAVDCAGTSNPVLVCCNIHGNAGGDWVGCIAGQDSTDHNFSADPMFCEADSADFTLQGISPCASDNNPSCGLVGAQSVGCAADFTTIQVVGDFNGWDEGTPGMTEEEPRVWVDTLAVDAGCHYMKFRTDNAWAYPPDYGTCTGQDTTCSVGLAGQVCLVDQPETALGQIDFPSTGNYEFRLDEADSTYTITLVAMTGVVEPGQRTPVVFFLGPAVPNPFNPVTEISYGIPVSDGASRVRMNVYDVLGRNVRTLVDADQAPGIYQVTWDGRDHNGVAVASGVYFYRVTWMEKSETKRMVLLK